MARRGRASFAKTRTPPESDQMGGVFVNASPGPYIAPTACLRPEKRICAARLTGNVLRLSAIFGAAASWSWTSHGGGSVGAISAGAKFERGWNLQRHGVSLLSPFYRQTTELLGVYFHHHRQQYA
jgi:hypothetical protein